MSSTELELTALCPELAEAADAYISGQSSKVLNELMERRDAIRTCLIGAPSSNHALDVLPKLAHAEELLEALGFKNNPFYVTMWRELLQLALGRGDQLLIARAELCLANGLVLQDEYTEAKALFEAALTRLEPLDQPLLRGFALEKYGECQLVTGQYDDAERLYRASLDIRGPALGERHPHSLLCLNGLANILCARQKYGEAEALHRQVLDARTAWLGPDHPDVASTLNNLGNVLELQQRPAEALECFRRALAIRESALGMNHPDTPNSLLCVLNAMETLGQVEAADVLRSEKWPF